MSACTEGSCGIPSDPLHPRSLEYSPCSSCVHSEKPPDPSADPDRSNKRSFLGPAELLSAPFLLSDQRLSKFHFLKAETSLSSEPVSSLAVGYTHHQPADLKGREAGNMWAERSCCVWEQEVCWSCFHQSSWLKYGLILLLIPLEINLASPSQWIMLKLQFLSASFFTEL